MNFGIGVNLRQRLSGVGGSVVDLANRTWPVMETYHRVKRESLLHLKKENRAHIEMTSIFTLL